MSNDNASKPKTILVINAGSSSIKVSLYNADTLDRIKKEKIEIKSEDEYDDAFKDILSLIDEQNVIGVGHRVVHGGQNYSAPEKITDAVLKELTDLSPLAPLHQPNNVRPIGLIKDKYPGMTQMACFDTAFHRTMPRLNEIFAIPRDLSDQGVIKYGFHGSSYEYITSVMADTIGEQQAKGRIIIAHLGNGASMCAVKDGVSVATTMGFTPLDGLMMGTRCGNVDPGLAFYLAQEKNMDLDQISELFRKQSGLLGVSGISSDMRVLLNDSSDEAEQAIDLFCRSAAKEAASLSVDLGGLDAMIFTAGIGENSQEIRDRITGQLAHLGDFDVHIIPTNEGLMIARHVKSELDNLAPNTTQSAAISPP